MNARFERVELSAPSVPYHALYGDNVIYLRYEVRTLCLEYLAHHEGFIVQNTIHGKNAVEMINWLAQTISGLTSSLEPSPRLSATKRCDTPI